MTRPPLPLPAWHPAHWLATWFGAGLLPRMPGSWGSAAALPFAWALQWAGGSTAVLVGVGLVFLAGWWAAETYVRASGTDDPGQIVIDEVAAQWLVLAATPLDPLLYLTGFLLFRLFDMAKPWPVSWADRYIAGGFGVMLDDMLAAVYALMLQTLLLWWWL